MGISVCIVSRNEADKLRPCLESLRWADEVIVMDLMSSDGSDQLLQEFGAKVIKREPHPIVEPLRNEIAEHASAAWILALDPDERITPGLAAALRQAAGRCDIDAVVIPRMNVDLGYPPTNALHRYEPQLRMYRRSTVQWPIVPNALPKVPEDRLLRLPFTDNVVMVHDRSRNIPEVLDRMLRYAPAQAQSMVDRGQVFTARKMLSALSSHFYKQFFRGQALNDGVPGLLRAGILVSFHFYVWAAFWQLSGGLRTPDDDRIVLRLGRFLEGIRMALKAAKIPRKLIKRITRKIGRNTAARQK